VDGTPLATIENDYDFNAKQNVLLTFPRFLPTVTAAKIFVPGFKMKFFEFWREKFFILQLCFLHFPLVLRSCLVHRSTVKDEKKNKSNIFVNEHGKSDKYSSHYNWKLNLRAKIVNKLLKYMICEFELNFKPIKFRNKLVYMTHFIACISTARESLDPLPLDGYSSLSSVGNSVKSSRSQVQVSISTAGAPMISQYDIVSSTVMS
jgi:hypothetical protein